MSFVNIYAEDIEEYAIKGISELGIDLTKCKNLLTEDLKYSIYYDDFNILVLNNHEKDLISKNIFTKKIQKLKVHPENFISYILDDEDGSTIITTHIDSIEDNLEVKRPFKIIDYLIFNFLAPLEFYLYLNSNGDIHLCRNAEIISKSVNIFSDIRLRDRNFTFSINDVIKIFHSVETQNLLIFFQQGTMLTYFIDTNNLNPNHTNINELNKKKILILQDFYDLSDKTSKNRSENISNQSSCMNFSYSNNQYNIKTFELINVKTIIQELDQNSRGYSLIVGFNLSNITYLKFFSFLVDNSNNIDSVAEESSISIYRLFQLGNAFDISNLIEINGTIVKDMKLFNFMLYNSNFILSSQFSEKLPDTIFFLMQSKSEGYFYFFISKLDYYLIETELINIYYFSKFTVDENLNSILNLNMMGVFAEDYYSKDFYENLNLSIRITYAKNKNQIFILDDLLINENIPDSKVIRNVKSNFLEVVTPNVFEYFEFYQKIMNDININDYENNSKKVIKNLIKSELLFINEIDHIVFKDKIQDCNENDENKIEFKNFDRYLAYLILSNNYISIKNYLTIIDPKKEDFPYVNNEKIFFTIKTLFEVLIKEIISRLKENKLHTDFFNNPKLMDILKILIKLLFINKSRAEVSIFKPYKLEGEILIENSITISKLIQQVESMILILKIMRYYCNDMIKLEEINSIERHKYKYFNVFVTLIFPDLEQNILPNIKLFYIKFIDKYLCSIDKGDSEGFETQQKELNIVLNNSLYVSKFMLFFVYAYFLILSQSILLTGNKQTLNFDLFEKETIFYHKIKYNISTIINQELHQEIDQYFELVYQIFLLDNFSNLKKQNIFYEIKIKNKLLSDFIHFLNKENYYFSSFENSISNFNSSFLNLLLEDEKYSDALLISKSIIQYYKDFHELLCQLKIFLYMDLLNMGFQFINNCFASLIKLPNANYSQISRSEVAKIKFFDELRKEHNFVIITLLYNEYFKFLINKDKIEFLFNLPLNIVERNILKDLILSEGKLEHLIILYYMKIKNIHASEIKFNDIKNSSNFNEENLNIYSKFIGAMKFIFGNKDSNIAYDRVNEGVDSSFINNTNKDYKMGINFKNNHILFEGKMLIKEHIINPDNKMDIIENEHLRKNNNMKMRNKNITLNINNFEKINDPLGDFE